MIVKIDNETVEKNIKKDRKFLKSFAKISYLLLTGFITFIGAISVDVVFGAVMGGISFLFYLLAKKIIKRAWRA